MIKYKFSERKSSTVSSIKTNPVVTQLNSCFENPNDLDFRTFRMRGVILIL